MFCKTLIAMTVAFLSTASLSTAQMFSEFEPAPATGSTTSFFEIFGDANTAFDLNIVSIENDGFNGFVDRSSNVTGMFDSNGLAVVEVPEIEAPSFSVFLVENLVTLGIDLDTDNDGNLDTSGFGTIFDAVGVSDSAADNSTLYAGAFGGSNILYNNIDEPLGVFREGSSGDFYQYVTADAGLVTEYVALFTADGQTELNPADFNFDPTTTSYNMINPSAVPEPTSIALLGLVGLTSGLIRRRRLG
ncbi:PEP-CTERM sorting domain-containing protein [Mariniblastus fucicola]|uniref:Ice-binding protein C-terminal domain-containing protein n=1 Tax=Mariniblastus fucicola TaxID=980251 RepID=A0A5B9P542_9BACT|nr:PEP-CTERM sorting domain-containing protein [Mariniblastus fucicola]QEG20609.1 hypothetical protein MFFC18_04590 [Mariniblastus fucicola]